MVLLSDVYFNKNANKNIKYWWNYMKNNEQIYIQQQHTHKQDIVENIISNCLVLNLENLLGFETRLFLFNFFVFTKLYFFFCYILLQFSILSFDRIFYSLSILDFEFFFVLFFLVSWLCYVKTHAQYIQGLYVSQKKIQEYNTISKHIVSGNGITKLLNDSDSTDSNNIICIYIGLKHGKLV